jgi:hypothetical protein
MNLGLDPTDSFNPRSEAQPQEKHLLAAALKAQAPEAETEATQESAKADVVVVVVVVCVL